MITKYVKISKRRITVSTAGIAPQIQKMGKAFPLVNLAVSLNAPNDEIRSRLMPINKSYNIKILMKACRAFPLPQRRRITFEYVLVKGVNDSIADAGEIVKLLKGIPSKINVIPLNTAPGIDLQTPEEHEIAAFQNALIKKGMTAIIRKSKGYDISAACGQLNGTSKESRK
jgi:23S rRNA (adenine2503-C2)-methyltransferase